MNIEERDKVLREYIEKEQGIMEGKGREYASDSDTLSNFKTIAFLLNRATPMKKECQECGNEVSFEITKYIVAAVYILKHVLAILDFAGREESLSTEDLSGRVLDLRVYAMLIDCLKRDEGITEDVDYTPTIVWQGDQVPTTTNGGEQ